MTTNEGSNIIENFMIPGADVFVLGRGHNHKSYCENTLFHSKFFASLPVMEQTNWVYDNDDQWMV